MFMITTTKKTTTLTAEMEGTEEVGLETQGKIIQSVSHYVRIKSNYTAH